ncbi:acyl-CoA oxidase [Persicimonas caeni]|uniref:acyl-CoA oxidase n=1 Tax=Persicimonas caeni TaxID=2292766 RepID=A0A4Y6PX70_PERCE|nr:acyl-CoA dehydrogenase [Persicimonas caeni]QDG52853.1 acyl-CoA oxidase [Persicimonas caeni]QED34075.1 acyl-CoA oxidase [Persicimonas caeni]
METPVSKPEARALIDHEQLLPIAPMVYVAWADGDLTSDEVRRIRQQAAEQDWLDESAKTVLRAWLDPEDPPSATQLTRLCRAINEAADELAAEQRLSLADLGVRIAKLDGPGEEPEWMNEHVHKALLDLEKGLGVVGEDATHALLHGLDRRAKERFHEAPARFDVEQMTRLLDGNWRDTWQKVREVLTSGGFDYAYELPKDEYRQQVFEWLQVLAEHGMGEMKPGGEEGVGPQMGRFMATFEALGMFDLSLVVKFGVQFGLFGGSILFLGTERHHEAYLEKVGSLELPGGFAMTELGHGSNVRDLRTTATYDADTGEFVIHTPDEYARKEWIGNAAVHAKMMTVFAQLEIGEDSYGVHAFLVPVRDDDGNTLEGVRIEDCGHKMGLNGVDNGRIWFDKVRVPRENLLDRYASVSAEGEYDSPIPSATKRFFTMLGTLVAGRISVGAAALTATKSALAIATRYGARRRQFGPAGEPEKPILNYRTHKRRLMPRIATAYGLHFAIDGLRELYIETRDQEDTREVEAMAAALKVFSTWNAIEAVQEARECCGGMGYLSENRIAPIRKDVDIFATFEGDNTVLMMLVARNHLSEYKQQFQDATPFTLARYLAKQASSVVQKRNPLVTRDTDKAHLRSSKFQRQIFRVREKDLLGSVARRLKARLDAGKDAFTAFNEVQDHLLSLSKATAERMVMESFADQIDTLEDGPLHDALSLLRDLYALEYIYRDIGWFLENGYIEPPKSRAIRDLLNELCEQAREQALPLVNAWGIPDEVLAAPIAFP